MKRLFLVIALFSTSAYAGVENMVAQCEALMSCNDPLCRVANDSSISPTKFITYVDAQGQPRAEEVSRSQYAYFQTGYKLAPNGKHLMCERIRTAIAREGNNPSTRTRAHIARALFNANWVRQEYCPFPAPQAK